MLASREVSGTRQGALELRGGDVQRWPGAAERRIGPVRPLCRFSGRHRAQAEHRKRST